MAAPAACTRFSDNYDIKEELGKYVNPKDTKKKIINKERVSYFFLQRRVFDRKKMCPKVDGIRVCCKDY